MITVSSMTTGKLSIKKAASKTKLNKGNGCSLGFKFKTITGIDVPIRMNRNMEIECLSFNGRDCEFGRIASESQCANYINQNEAKIKPLVCGAMHLKIYGYNGFNRPSHWCEIGRKFYYENWHCQDQTGMGTPIKFDPVTKNVECLSSNGSDCIRDQNICTKANKSKIDGKTLICGSGHEKVHGGRNPYYADGVHWCKQGNQWLTGSTSWFCGGDNIGLDSPLRYNEQGDIECFSIDGINCAWESGTGQNCIDYMRNNIIGVNPVVCGADFTKQQWGLTGYESADHWCSVAQLKFVLNGRQE